MCAGRLAGVAQVQSQPTRMVDGGVETWFSPTGPDRLSRRGDEKEEEEEGRSLVTEMRSGLFACSGFRYGVSLAFFPQPRSFCLMVLFGGFRW